MGRSILFVTGTRADFGKQARLAAAARDAGHDVAFFVTGMHMLGRYGLTKLEVRRMDGIAVHEVLNQRPGDPQDAVLAKTVLGFSDFLAEHRPDLVVVHGDRIEALAATLTASINYVRCAHVEGGEISGTIDEMFRHCNSKLAHAHFVSSEAARRRVMALGEPGGAVHVIGSPELDAHAAPSGVTLDEVRARYEIPWESFGIAILHPVTSEAADMGVQAAAFFDALAASGRPFVVILPNNDPGAEGMLAVIGGLPVDRFRTLPSMRFAHFSEALRHAACLVGNSSAGVREAPFLGVPSLDVGTRQDGRARAASLRRAGARDRAAILDFLAHEWGRRYPRHEAFGQGRAATRFVEVLADPGFWTRPLQKRFAEADG